MFMALVFKTAAGAADGSAVFPWGYLQCQSDAFWLWCSVPSGLVKGEVRCTCCSYSNLYQHKNAFLNDLGYSIVSPEILKIQQ